MSEQDFGGSPIKMFVETIEIPKLKSYVEK